MLDSGSNKFSLEPHTGMPYRKVAEEHAESLVKHIRDKSDLIRARETVKDAAPKATNHGPQVNVVQACEDDKGGLPALEMEDEIENLSRELEVIVLENGEGEEELGKEPGWEWVD